MLNENKTTDWDEKNFCLQKCNFAVFTKLLMCHSNFEAHLISKTAGLLHRVHAVTYSLTGEKLWLKPKTGSKSVWSQHLTLTFNLI